MLAQLPCSLLTLGRKGRVLSSDTSRCWRAAKAADFGLGIGEELYASYPPTPIDKARLRRGSSSRTARAGRKTFAAGLSRLS